MTSAGNGGNGFYAAADPPTKSQSDRARLTVKSNPNLTLEVRTNNGQIVIPSDSTNKDTIAPCVWIDETPAMPQLTVKVVGLNGAQVTGTATWQLETTFDWLNRVVGSDKTWVEHDVHAVPLNPVTMPADQTWTVPWPSTGCGLSNNDPCLFGGYAHLYWSYKPSEQQPGEVQDSFNFYICGEKSVLHRGHGAHNQRNEASLLVR